jgi:hypothetical protein
MAAFCGNHDAHIDLRKNTKEIIDGVRFTSLVSWSMRAQGSLLALRIYRNVELADDAGDWHKLRSMMEGTLVKIIRTLLCLLSIFLVSASASAQSLYGSAAAGATGRLYRLNPATGAVIQDIGPLNDVTGLNYPITGLAFHPTTGMLYGSTGNNPSTTAARFVRINPATAQVTVIGSFNAGPTNASGTPATMADLSFDSTGNLYGVGSIGGPQLYSINLATGQATVVGNTGITSTTGGGIEISTTGAIFGTPTASRFGTYDGVTGAFMNIANPDKPAGGGGYGALTFIGNTLYGLNVGPGSPPPTHLVTINTTTGAVTDIGASPNSLDAIAFRSIPEPTTLTLVLGVLPAGLRRNGRARKVASL